jgi:hypothetical protein
MLKKSVLAAAFLGLTFPAFADVMCASGNLANLIGTTCDISPSLQFTFTRWDSENDTFSLHSGYTYLATGPAASNFTFTALSDGFALSGSSPVVTGPGGDSASEAYGVLWYNLFDPVGFITGENVTSTGLSATGSDRSIAEAMDNGALDQVYQIGGVAGTSILSAGYHDFDQNGYAWAYLVQASSTADSASWNGTSTFTFTTTIPLPEPSSFLLFGAVVCLLCFARHRTDAHRAVRPASSSIHSDGLEVSSRS